MLGPLIRTILTRWFYWQVITPVFMKKCWKLCLNCPCHPFYLEHWTLTFLELQWNQSLPQPKFDGINFDSIFFLHNICCKFTSKFHNMCYNDKYKKISKLSPSNFWLVFRSSDETEVTVSIYIKVYPWHY